MAGNTRLRYASLMNSSFSDGTSTIRSPPVCARPRKRTRTLIPPRSMVSLSLVMAVVGITTGGRFAAVAAAESFLSCASELACTMNWMSLGNALLPAVWSP